MSRNHRKWNPVDLRGFLPKSAVVPDFPSEREPVDRQKEESEVFCPSPVWGPHECQRCGKVYSHHSGLSRHKRQCEGRLQESCGVCGRAFYRSDHYKSHMKHKHGLDVDGSVLPEASFQNEDKVFAPVSSLCGRGRDPEQRDQFRLDRKFACPRCGREYSQSAGLSRHKRQCEGRAIRRCGVCSRSFYRIDMFREHMSIQHHIAVDL
ncbi:zinc finger protein 771-like [Pomacea canaliculata]|uniref:zinc finger protein 771-like n=1 Tax=Pomacea canaliculata TaxID=400727 RepID=UPI000D7393E4|nr:zinc finger protein 771-like [Pomacea canaliculata]